MREALCNGGKKIRRKIGEERSDDGSSWCAALDVELLYSAAGGGEGRGDGPAAHEISAQNEVLVSCRCQVGGSKQWLLQLKASCFSDSAVEVRRKL